MKTHVEFRSDRFPPYEGEEEQINPGRWGKRLAEFLCEGLRQQGYAPSEPVAEDWGWAVGIAQDPFPLWIACGCYPEYDDGFLCFIQPDTPTIRKWFRTFDTREQVEALQRAIDEVLAESAGIRGKRWWTSKEFNNPGSVSSS